MDSSVGGTAIDARTAATQHQAWVKNLGGSYRIGAPGVARGSKKWLSVRDHLTYQDTLLMSRTGYLLVMGNANTTLFRSIITVQTLTT